MHDDSSGGDEKPKRRGSYVGDKYMPLPTAPARERGGCLTAFLVVVIAVNALILFSLCAQYFEVTSNSWLYRDSGSVKGILILSWLIQVAILASAVALWNWKVWGFYGTIGGLLLMIAGHLCAGNIMYAVGAGIGLTILFWLIIPNLDTLE